jgi:hypothetical protein
MPDVCLHEVDNIRMLALGEGDDFVSDQGQLLRELFAQILEDDLYELLQVKGSAIP